MLVGDDEHGAVARGACRGRAGTRGRRAGRASPSARRGSGGWRARSGSGRARSAGAGRPRPRSPVPPRACRCRRGVRRARFRARSCAALLRSGGRWLGVRRSGRCWRSRSRTGARPGRRGGFARVRSRPRRGCFARRAGWRARSCRRRWRRSARRARLGSMVRSTPSRTSGPSWPGRCLRFVALRWGCVRFDKPGLSFRTHPWSSRRSAALTPTARTAASGSAAVASKAPSVSRASAPSQTGSSCVLTSRTADQGRAGDERAEALGDGGGRGVAVGDGFEVLRGAVEPVEAFLRAAGKREFGGAVQGLDQLVDELGPCLALTAQLATRRSVRERGDDASRRSRVPSPGAGRRAGGSRWRGPRSRAPRSRPPPPASARAGRGVGARRRRSRTGSEDPRRAARWNSRSTAGTSAHGWSRAF